MAETREQIEQVLPQQNHFLVGAEAAEEDIMKAVAAGRVHHAWLISGMKGTGKATLAYRFARWLLAGATPQKAEEEGASLFGDALPALPAAKAGLAVDETSVVASQVAAGSHPDLLVISQYGDEEKVKEEITVDEVRKIAHFLSLTPSQSRWRVVIVDDADSMNRNAANALLKLLEEPPPDAILLLVSHAPGKLLPTIRSRCRTLKLRPLAPPAMQQVLERFLPGLPQADMDFVIALAGGSPGMAMQLAEPGVRELYNQLITLLPQLPGFSVQECLALAQTVGGRGQIEAWRMFGYLLQHLVAGIVEGLMTGEYGTEAIPGENNAKKAMAGKASLDKWLDLWEKMGQIFVDVHRVNMDRRHSALCLLESFRSMAA
jgi:DNA polymerase-3 subunit delta'